MDGTSVGACLCRFGSVRCAGIDRLAWYAYHAHEITRDELLFAWLRPELRSTATVAAYSQMLTYLPGGATFESGLFGWESTLLSNPIIPRRGRLLLAAAGGGRELKALLGRGYAVTAFEPNPVLFEGARAITAGRSDATLVQASYQDLLLVAKGDGRLFGLRDQQFDIVLFGWGSFTHITETATQLAVLRAVRELAPNAPLLLSYFLRKPEKPNSKTQRMRQVIRESMRRLGRSNEVTPGLGYDSGGGFVYSFSNEEIADLAIRAGYRVALQEAEAFPHAILVPA